MALESHVKKFVFNNYDYANYTKCKSNIKKATAAGCNSTE